MGSLYNVVMSYPLVICLLSASQIRNVQSIDPVELYLKPQYTEEGEYLKDYLIYNDVGEDDQEFLPRSLHVAFKIITTDYSLTNVATGSAEYQNIKDNATAAIEKTFDFNIKQLKVVNIRKYKKDNEGLIFGFIRLHNEEDTKAVESLMKEHFLNGSIGGLSVSDGFCSSLREVEHNSVIHISIQFWNEPWLYGLEDETSDARRDTTDNMLHLIQPRFRMIFGEHYYRTVIADLQRTPDSMVVHAYVLLDPDKDNLYHSYTVWFSSEGHVKFGRWILFPANIHVERAQLVPNRYWSYLSDRTYFAPMAFSSKDPLITITLPTFCVGMSVIVVVVGTLSLYHYLAYVRGRDKLKLSSPQTNT